MSQRPGLRKWIVSLNASPPTIELFALAVVLAACAPPPLTDAGDAGRSADGAGGGSGEATFSRVAEIVRNDCAKAGCHAGEGNAGFGVEGGAASTDDQVRETLEGTTVDGDPTQLIEPGEPADSAIFQALNGMDGRTPMPPGEDLAPEKIETIRRWIARGAPYE